MMANISPCGWRILVEVEEVQETSEGGIIVSTGKELKREQEGSDIGRVLAIGNTAYLGCNGCESSEDWGFDVGDLIEFRRYDGKLSAFDETGRLRYINDVDVMGVYK